ncbi:hypothetical protein TorRG33x02_241250 [Trema orientale]|uniref:Uncharacterized protein n=1 Tax=Trema orientale TaxID=63057 RepID=A0A2P5DUG7_TREOI|nr:hypothetical protein TorRG33x02_241250 [Trema orientale]
MNEACASFLGNNIGILEETEVKGASMRIRARIPINEPLRRGHRARGYTKDNTEGDVEDNCFMQYGPWLRASMAQFRGKGSPSKGNRGQPSSSPSQDTPDCSVSSGNKMVRSKVPEGSKIGQFGVDGTNNPLSGLCKEDSLLVTKLRVIEKTTEQLQSPIKEAMQEDVMQEVNDLSLMSGIQYADSPFSKEETQTLGKIFKDKLATMSLNTTKKKRRPKLHCKRYSPLKLGLGPSPRRILLRTAISQCKEKNKIQPSLAPTSEQHLGMDRKGPKRKLLDALKAKKEPFDGCGQHLFWS